MSTLLMSTLNSLFLLFSPTCAIASNSDAEKIVALEKQVAELKPGFGEIMGVVQQHHAKLFYAGSAKNWSLADYELDEIKEGLEDLEKYYPTFKEIKAHIDVLIPKIMNGSLQEVSSAILSKDEAKFLKSFNVMTNSCNTCHQAAEHGFIVIQAPKGREFTNQKFEP